MKNFKIIVSIIISLVPLNFLKIFFYKIFLNINIKNSKIGFFIVLNGNKINITNSNICNFNYISCNNVSIDDSLVKKNNFFQNINYLKINNVKIGKNNKFQSPLNNAASRFEILEKSSIGNFNFFDLTDSIYIKENSIIDNFCQLWTHGFSSERIIKKGGILINSNIKIESGVIINYNVRITDNVIIKAGSVIAKSILEEGLYGNNIDLIKK